MKFKFWHFSIAALLMAACNNTNSSSGSDAAPTTNSALPQTINFNIVNAYPHDTAAFTEGLEWHNNALYESTGNKGSSKLAKTKLETGADLQKISLANNFFGEGITIINNKIFQLTYQENKCFVYDLKTFAKINEFSYEGEGWGLTNNGKHIIMSNGSNNLYFRDTATFKVANIIGVTDNNGPLASINELEYVKGFVFANVWMTNKIVKIDAESGKVVGVADFTGVLDKFAPGYQGRIDVLNGIAYDSTQQRFFVTGKYWPKTFEVKMQ